MTIERQVAEQIAHRERTQATLARTGGEIMHPDHYDFREAIRLAVLRAFDETTEAAGNPKLGDEELPRLFKTIDAISERLFRKSRGL